MILEILPHALYAQAQIKVYLRHNNNAIIYKTLSTNLIDKEMFLSSMVIIYLVKGEQVIKNYDAETITVKQGEMIALPSDMYLVSDFVAKNEAFEAMLFFIDNDVASRYILSSDVKSKTKSDQNKTISSIVTNQIIHEFVQSIQPVYKEETLSELVELKLMELLYLIGLEKQNIPFLSSLSASTKRRSIRKLMDENYLNNLNVNDYASLSGRSLTTFIREFKRLYGTTPNKWLIEQRLNKAQDLLQNTTLNVTDVSMEVGYENVSHFISAYKSRFGITPKKEK